MKNTTYILSLSTAILLIGCVYLFICNRQLQSNQEILQSLDAHNTNELRGLRLHKINRSNEIIFNGKMLNKNGIVIDEEGNEKLLSEIIDGNKLVLRYSDLNCNTCIDEQINNLNSNTQQIGIENIILLTTYESYVHMQRFRKVNKIKFPIYNLGNELNKDIEDLGLPYYFILNKDNFRINNMYIAMKEIPKLTSIYLEHIKQEYFTIKESTL